MGDASEACCPCAGYSCSVWSEARVGAAVACQQPVVGAGQGCCQEPAPPAAVPGGGCLRWAGSGSCRGRSGGSSSSSGSGWPSGLRRCIQVAVSLGGVGSTPTPDRLFSLLASFPLLTAGFLLLWGLCSALAAVPAPAEGERAIPMLPHQYQLGRPTTETGRESQPLGNSTWPLSPAKLAFCMPLPAFQCASLDILQTFAHTILSPCNNPSAWKAFQGVREGILLLQAGSHHLISAFSFRVIQYLEDRHFTASWHPGSHA